MNFQSVFLAATILIGGSFQFGYQTGVINEPLELLKEFIANSSSTRNLGYSNGTVSALSTVAVAVFPAGGLIGALLAGWMADGFGRKWAMVINMIPFIVASLLMILSRLANSFEMLIIGRFLVGIPSGAVTALAPMYLSEISPLHLRGALGTMNQFIIVIAILISQVLGLKYLLGTETLWPYLLGFTLISSTFALIGFQFCPESPRYLMLTKNDESAARDALHRLRGTLDVEEEISEMRREQEAIGSMPKISILQAFRLPYLRLPLMMGIIMQLSQQLSGINAVINYSTDIFETSAQLTKEDSVYSTIGIGGLNVLVTAVSVFIMDKAGRKTLHLTGLSLMAVFTLIITVALNVRHQFPADSAGRMGMVYLAVAAVFLYVASFAIGPGAIPWFIVAEMFTQSSRGAAMTVCVAVNWLCQIAIAEGYPFLQDYLKDYSFVPFLVILTICAVYTWWQVPETKGKTPEEMEIEFKRRVHMEVDYQSMNDTESPESPVHVDASPFDM